MEPDDHRGEEGSRSDPGTETGVEASMSRLGLGGGGGNELSYPERPDEPDCVYYLRTGVCGYGSRCQFNHPPNRPPVLGDHKTEAGEVPERMGQPVCQHFMRTGACKFGASCKYHHPRQGSGGGGGDSVTSPISFNHMGFPLRPGEKECPYYMRTGQCKFGSTCKFHHPVPPCDQAPSQHPLPTCPQPIYPSQQFGVAVPRPYGTTYSQMVLPPPGMVGWNPYHQASSVSAIPSPGTLGPSPVYGTTPLSPSAPAYQSPNKEQSFPQRPGQPECTYFLRTGDCKYGTSCRYHHPLEAAASPKGVTLTHIGLPLRPGTAQCSEGTEVHSSSSIKPITATSGGSETVAAGVSSSSSMTGGVSHSEPSGETKNGDSASIEVKTSS